MITSQGVAAAVATVAAVAEAIQELKEVPSGHLYAQLMGVMDLRTYNAVISALKKAGLITESNHLLTWVGGDLKKS